MYLASLKLNVMTCTQQHYREKMKTVFLDVMKYSPIVSSLIFFAHYIFGFFGIRTIATDITIDLSLFPAVFCLAASVVFGFCRLHRLFILYSMFCSLDIDLHRWGYDLLGELSDTFWPFVFLLVGAYLFTRLICMFSSRHKRGK